jgi:hypothetical protein
MKNALGTVNWVIEALRKAGHLVDLEGAAHRLVKRDILLENWVAAYPQQLRPKNLLGRHVAQNATWWLTADLKACNALWGGETAAALETGYLEPETTTVYVDENPNNLIIRYKLKRDPLGPIHVFKKFWHFEDGERLAVPYILTYADLLATGDDRNAEAARIIYEQELDRYLR